MGTSQVAKKKLCEEIAWLLLVLGGLGVQGLGFRVVMGGLGYAGGGTGGCKVFRVQGIGHRVREGFIRTSQMSYSLNSQKKVI